MSDKRTYRFFPNEENVQLRNPLKGLSRNDKCLCGSGKKFKKCCLPKLEQPVPPPAPTVDANNEETQPSHASVEDTKREVGENQTS